MVQKGTEAAACCERVRAYKQQHATSNPANLIRVWAWQMVWCHNGYEESDGAALDAEKSRCTHWRTAAVSPVTSMPSVVKTPPSSTAVTSGRRHHHESAAFATFQFDNPKPGVRLSMKRGKFNHTTMVTHELVGVVRLARHPQRPIPVCCALKHAADLSHPHNC